MKTPKYAFPYVFLFAALLGFNSIISRSALQSISPYTLNAVRVIITAFIYLAAFAVLPSWRWPRDPMVWLQAGLWGIIGFALPLTAFMNVLRYFSAGVTSLLGTTSPVIVAILSHFLLKDERLNLTKVLGSLIAFIGVSIILLSGETGLGSLSQPDWRGYVWVAVGVFSGASGVVYSRLFLRKMDTIQATGIRTLVACVALVGLAWGTGNMNLQPILRPQILLSLVYLASVGTFFAFILEFRIIQWFGAGPASQMSYLLPPVATSLGVIFLNEEVNLVFFLGMAVIFAGLFLVNSRNNNTFPSRPIIT
jgi:drug/metabolite transporter (DMT)-like permease